MGLGDLGVHIVIYYTTMLCTTFGWCVVVFFSVLSLCWLLCSRYPERVLFVLFCLVCRSCWSFFFLFFSSLFSFAGLLSFCFYWLVVGVGLPWILPTYICMWNYDPGWFHGVHIYGVCTECVLRVSIVGAWCM